MSKFELPKKFDYKDVNILKQFITETGKIIPARVSGVSATNQRKLTKTPIGFKSIKLERAIRAHANFCETVPINFFLSLLLYFNNLLMFVVPAIIILCIGRTIHAISLSNINEDLTQRRRGMRLTLFSIYIQLLGILYYIFQLIYIFIKSLEQSI